MEPSYDDLQNEGFDDHLSQLGIGYVKLIVPSVEFQSDDDNIHQSSWEDLYERDDVSVLTFNQKLIELFAVEQHIIRSQSYRINKMNVQKIISADLLQESLYGSNFQNSSYNNSMSIIQLLDNHLQQKRMNTDRVFMVSHQGSDSQIKLRSGFRIRIQIQSNKKKNMVNLYIS